MLKYFKLVLLQLFLFTGVAHAYCGNDNTATLACPAPDGDNDDYATNGTGRLAGVDCDDTKWQIFPGITTGTGCSAGEVHTCQPSGVYTSCIPLSSFTAATGSGNNYWISPSGVTTAGCGAIGTPCDYRCLVNNALGCYHSPVPGDAFIARGGTYSATWVDGSTVRMFFIFVKNGTALNPIIFMAAPGEVASFASPGVAPTEIPPIYIESSSYWKITGFTIHGGYSNAGITFESSIDGEIYNNTIYDIDGDGGNRNLSGIKYSSGSDRIYVHHNLTYDNYERSNPTNPNNVGGVTGFNSNTTKINNNVSYTTVVGGAGNGFKIKHGYIGGSGSQMMNNVAYNFRAACFQNAQPGIEIAYNRFINCNLQNSGSSIEDLDIGGVVEFRDVNIHHNLIVNASAVEFDPETTYAAIGASALNYHHNIVVDNKAVYPTSGTNGFLRICNYCSDALYTNVVTGGKLAFSSNCYFNTLSTALLFDLFANSGSGSLGQNYIGLPAWKAAGFGYDSNSFNKNPLLDAYLIPTEVDCVDKGWRPAAAPAAWGKVNKRLVRGFR